MPSNPPIARFSFGECGFSSQNRRFRAILAFRRRVVAFSQRVTCRFAENVRRSNFCLDDGDAAAAAVAVRGRDGI